MRRMRGLLAAVVALTLVIAAVPGGALARDAAPVGSLEPLGTSYEVDAYDAAGLGDSIPANARNVTALIGDYGVERIENHTFHVVNGTSGDIDWVKFTVTADDVNIDKTSFLFRVESPSWNLDSVIEIYGPNPTSSFAYTAGYNAGAGDSAFATTWNDEDFWRRVGHDSALVFRPSVAGTYYVRVRPYSTGGVYSCDAHAYKLIMKRGLINRISGSTRIETAIAVSKALYQSATAPAMHNFAVVVANGFNYPDALGGAVLCGVADGPLLLTNPTSLSAGVGDEIKRLGADRVYVVGGPAAVSDTVFSQLQALNPGIGVYRVQGDDRIQTAAEIALQAKSDAAGYGESIPTLAIIAYAFNYPDALAATPVAACRNVPILLTGTNSLAADTDEALNHLGTTDVIIMGSTTVISTAVENQLKTKFGSTHVLRVAGGDRYETAKEFASWCTDLKGPGARGDTWVGTLGTPTKVYALNPAQFGIASGETYADALPGGVATGLCSYPILLTKKSTPYGYITAEHDGWLPAGDTDWVTDFHDQHVYAFGPCMLFGGPPAVTQTTAAVLDNSLMLINAP